MHENEKICQSIGVFQPPEPSSCIRQRNPFSSAQTPQFRLSFSPLSSPFMNYIEKGYFVSLANDSWSVRHHCVKFLINGAFEYHVINFNQLLLILIFLISITMYLFARSRLIGFQIKCNFAWLGKSMSFGIPILVHFHSFTIDYLMDIMSTGRV